MISSRRLSVLLLCGLLSACALGKPSFSLPDRSDVTVRQEEARVAAVLAADTSGKLLSQPLQGPAKCEVRLLRKVSSTDFVYAECTAGDEGFAFPLKLDGRTVTSPDDGSYYASSISRIFPSDIAAALNADAERYRP
ncbi:MAG TPA: hypothetical protein VLL08_07000 [Kineosporiaceae bacterium]|nr:hypothetical protein [Kineosporiaceae bacterium]